MPASAGAVDIQRVVSPKGIEAWLVEEHTVPVIAMSFAFDGGSAQDPAGKAGVANMLSGLLDEGAGDLDSRAFQTALDEYSIGLSFDAVARHLLRLAPDAEPRIATRPSASLAWR